MASSASSGNPVWMAERNVPGQTQLTRMPSRGVLDRGHLGQLDHRRLGGAVGTRMRPRRESRDRGGEDDRAGVLRPHDPHGRPDTVHRAEDVDPEGPFPLLRGQVVDASVRREDAGVADEDVDPPEALDRPRHHRLDLAGVAHVGEHGLGRSRVRRHAGQSLGQRLLRPVAQDECRTGFARQTLRHRRAERAARPRHDDDAAGLGPLRHARTSVTPFPSSRRPRVTPAGSRRRPSPPCR